MAEFDYVSNDFNLLIINEYIEDLIQAKKHARLMGYGIYGKNKYDNDSLILGLNIEKRNLIRSIYDKLVIRNNLQGKDKALYNKYKKI